jgi:ABC-type uncharacterized transport system ATPase subunit
MVSATSLKVTRAQPVAGEGTGGSSLGPSMLVKKTIVAALAGSVRTAAANATARRVKWRMGFLPERRCLSRRRTSHGHA